MGDQAATGFTVLLPPEWRQIPLKQGTNEAIRRALDDALAKLRRDLPRDKVAPYRTEIERRVRELAAEARRNGGLQLYLPVEPMHGTPVAASFVVSEGTLGLPDDADPAALVAHLASEEGARPMTIDGAVAARFERTAPPQPSREVEHSSRRVDYVVSMPGERDRWLIFVFSTLGAGEPDDQLSGILVELFDAIMSTFRWRG